MTGSPEISGDWPVVAIRCDMPVGNSVQLVVNALLPVPGVRAVITPFDQAHSFNVSVSRIGDDDVPPNRAQGVDFWTEGGKRLANSTGSVSGNAATGATFDLALKEEFSGQTDFGRIDGISGSVDCGDQHFGDSTLTIDGTSPDGPIRLPRTPSLDPVRVECDRGVILVTGFAWSGVPSDFVPNDGPPARFTMTISPSRVTLEPRFQVHFTTYVTYSVRHAGAARFTSRGAHLDTTLSGRVQFGNHFETYKVRVKGDVTCGAYGRM